MKLEQSKGILATVLILLVIMLVGCDKNRDITKEKSISTQIQDQIIKNEVTISNMKENKNSTEETETHDFEKLGITIQLPKNINWIGNPTYSIIDESVAQVEYYDKIARTDVTLRVGKMDIKTLSGIGYSFDAKREKTWSARTIDGKNINIKVQHTILDNEDKGVLFSWNYKEFNYTLWGNASNKKIDASPIAKTAVYIANNMR